MTTIEQQVREAFEQEIAKQIERLTKMVELFAKARHVKPEQVILTLRPQISVNPSLDIKP